MNGICHVEIPTVNLDRVSKFYSEIFGWESEYMKEFDYSTFKTPEGVGGGFSKQLKVAGKGIGILIYIMVGDIEATLKNIESHGGKTVSPKSPIPGVGHIGVFADSEGNEIGLFSA
jgi:predicted enzyme related to lactoylglutathione lyase